MGRGQNSITGSEAASMFSSRMREYRAAEKVHPELLARLAISLAMDAGEADRTPSFAERVQGVQVNIDDTTSIKDLLTPTEQAFIPAAETMLNVYAKGHRD